MKREFSVALDGTNYKIAIEGNTVLVNGQPFVVGLEGDRVLVDGTPYEVKLQGDQAIVGGIAHSLAVEGLAEAKAGRAASRAVAAGEGAVLAIMPGKIIRMLVGVGDPVAEGQVVCILEAMKMENELKAPKAGKVKAVHAQPGRDVERGTVLAEIE
jgi:biotin carboxyl carrier protein